MQFTQAFLLGFFTFLSLNLQATQVEVKQVIEDAPTKEASQNEGLNSISQNLTSQQKPDVSSELDDLAQDYSWFFDSKATKQEAGLVPTYFTSRIYGRNLGLRLFTFPRKEGEGYHFALSFLNRWNSSDIKIRYNYKKLFGGLEASSEGEYSTYFQPYYGEGMDTRISDREDIHAHKISSLHQVTFRVPNNFFIGALAHLIFRKELPSLQDGKSYFDSEFLLSSRLLLGYDSRDNRLNTRKGQYHQVSLGCTPSLSEAASFCSTEGDLRLFTWIPGVYTDFYLAFRAFAGMHLLGPASYSMAYTLGGSKNLRGFSDNRFRGDNIYLLQAEVRKPLWKEILSTVLFVELGEVTSYQESFSRPKWDYGLGFRLGFPPSYSSKIRFDLGVSTEKDSSERFNFIVDFHQAF